MKAFERKLLLPYARGLFNLYGLLGFLAIIFGVGAAIYSQTTQETMPRTKWLKSSNEQAKNTRGIITTMPTSYGKAEDEKRIERYTGYMMNDPRRVKLPVEKDKYSECLSKSTYQEYKYIDNPEQRDEKTFPWSVWKPGEFEVVLKRGASIDPAVVGEDFINAVCKKVHMSPVPLKPKHTNTNTKDGYSPWIDLGYRIQAIGYADARYDDYTDELLADNLKKTAALPIGLWSIAAGSGAVAIAALVISFMGIESNLRELERRTETKTDEDQSTTSS